jgi:GNAT superfamily N-acetyltransferase
VIRPATPDDTAVIVGLVRELADYERSLDQVQLTEQQLGAALFGVGPALFCHVAEQDGEVVGMALWFLSFSTWEGTHGIYLEDLYVRPSARGGGHGRALLASLADVAVRRGYSRVEWAVLDWNEPAIGFYRSLGSEPMDEWTVWRLTGKPLQSLAAK